MVPGARPWQAIRLSGSGQPQVHRPTLVLAIAGRSRFATPMPTAKEPKASSPQPRRAGSRPTSGARFYDPEADLRVGATLWDWLARWLLVGMAVILVHGAWKVGPTYDEHFYIAAGYHYWETGDFSLNREHPPLLKLMAGFPLRHVADVDVAPAGEDLINPTVDFFYQRNNRWLDRNLFLARLPFCLLTVLLAWGVFRTARYLFGPRAAFAGLALFALNPNVLAHGRLASLDGGATAFLFLSVMAFVAALERPTAWRILGAGILFGLAQLAKFSSLVLIPGFVVLTLVQMLRNLRKSRRRLQSPVAPLWNFARVALVGLSIFSVGYFFEAKSANEAYAKNPYLDADPPVEITPVDLAKALVEAHDDPGYHLRVEDVATAVSMEQALDRWAGLLTQAEPEGAADAAAAAIVRLAEGPGEDRKRAFELLLEAPADRVSFQTRLEALAGLAEKTLVAENGDPLPADENGIADWAGWFEDWRFQDWDQKLFYREDIDLATRGLLGDTRKIPLFSAFQGIDFQLNHGSIGHSSYYRGQILRPGPNGSFQDGNPFPEYYSDVMFVKNPIGFVAACSLGLLFAIVIRRRWTFLHLFAYVGIPAALFYMFSTSNALMGVRYVLPVFPFLAILAARAELLLPRLGLLLAIAAAAESLWIHPHQLMYYNLAVGGPKGGPEITVVGDDWGQDVRQLGRYYQEHAEEIETAGGLLYNPYTKADLESFGLEASRLIGPSERGIVAVHENLFYRNPQDYEWLRDFKPYERLGWSIRLYDLANPLGEKPEWH